MAERRRRGRVGAIALGMECRRSWGGRRVLEQGIVRMVGAVHRVLLFKRMVWNMWIHVMLVVERHVNSRKIIDLSFINTF